MVILHEILKLLHYSGAQDVKFFRIGTSGGLGICFNWFNSYYQQSFIGSWLARVT